MSLTNCLFNTRAMNNWYSAFRLIGIGFFIVGAIIGGLFVGLWLDNLLELSILWLVGLIFGIITAFWGVYRLLLPFLNDDRKGKN